MTAGQRLVPAVLAALGISLAAAPAISQAQQKFPSKPIRIIIATTAGSQPDGIARMIAQKMSENWGYPVVIDNRAGAGGVLAADIVAKATPDGHTLLYAIPNFAISAAIQPSLRYDPIKDFVPVSHIGISTNIMVASPSLAAKSVSELVALAKSQPGKLIVTSSAAGSAAHFTATRFHLITGIKTVHVGFKGGPEALIEVLGGRAHYHVGTMGVCLPFIREGKLTALAVSTPTRAPVLPDVPTLGETLPEFSRPDTSHGMLAPAGTPRPVVAALGKEVARILGLPEVKERLQAISYVVAPSPGDEYGKLLRSQIDALTRVASDAGMRPR